MTCGVYKLNFADKAFYIGQSQNIEQRFKQHISILKRGASCNYKLADAFLEYGMPSLTILEVCHIDTLHSREIDWIKNTNAQESGLNIHSGGLGFPSSLANPNSKYSKEEIISAFELIVENKLSLIEISKMLCINYSVVSDICNARYYLWLSELFPLKFNTLVSLRGTRISANGKNSKTAIERGIVYPKLKRSDGIIFTVENASKFAKEHKIGSGSLFDLLKGRKTTHREWSVCQ